MNCQTIPTCKGGLFGGPAGKLAQRSGDRAASEPPAPAGRAGYRRRIPPRPWLFEHEARLRPGQGAARDGTPAL